MMDPQTMRWANENPSEYRKQKDKIGLAREITQLEEKLASLKRTQKFQAELDAAESE